MQYNNKEITEALVNRLPPKRGTGKSPMIIALDELQVGESITVNRDEWESAGYVTPFSSLDGFVSSATYQRRVGKTGKVYKVKISEERVMHGIGPNATYHVVWRLTWWNRWWYALRNFLKK